MTWTKTVHIILALVGALALVALLLRTLLPLPPWSLWVALWVLLVVCFSGLFFVREHYLGEYLTVQRLSGLTTVDAATVKAFESARTIHGILDALLLGGCIATGTFMVTHASFFTNAIREQVIAALAGIVEDPTPIQGHERAIRRGAVLASATAIRGADADELYKFIEANVFQAFDHPIRRNMMMEYRFTPLLGHPSFFSLESTYDWQEFISKEAREDFKDELRVVYYRIKSSVEQKHETRVTIDDAPVAISWTQGKDRPRGELLEETYEARVPVLLKRERPSRFRIVRTDRIPVYDYSSYTAFRATNGFRLEVTWTPDTHMTNLELWVFTARADPKRLEPVQSGTGYRKWEYTDWLLPGCGFLLTWQPISPRESKGQP